METTGLNIVVKETLAMVDLLITDETVLAFNLRAELRQLLKLLTKIHGVLPDPVDRDIKGDISSWLTKLTDLVYKVEDVIDELAYEILRPKVTHFSLLQKLIFNLKFGLKVRILNHSLDMTNLEEIKCDQIVIPVSAINRVRDPVLDNPIIGREAEASQIVNLLIRSSGQQVLTVVPIVGMCGLGKTALAKLVSHQVRGLNLFDVRKWVCLADKCDELKVLGQMLQSLNALMEGIINKKSKSFLLVLDDVCEDVGSWWGDFRTRLLKMCTNNGNVVLITTRSEQVAFLVETSFQHRHTLGFLSDDDCRFIFKERAYRNVTERVRSYLEVREREIVKKCGGVPLVANVLGWTLGLSKDGESWSKIRESRFLKARDVEESVMSVLKLSFDHFPSSLKSCFALCSVFPKCYSIVKEDLIQMWIAERFVASSDMGNKYFNTLLENSFFQDTESDDDGRVINCKLHNLVHDLALSLEKSEMDMNYLYADYQSIRISEATKGKYLSTIILNVAPFQGSWNSKHLRTLYLNDVDMENFSSSMGKLHSWYLNFVHFHTLVPELHFCTQKYLNLK